MQGARVLTLAETKFEVLVWKNPGKLVGTELGPARMELAGTKHGALARMAAMSGSIMVYWINVFRHAPLDLHKYHFFYKYINISFICIVKGKKI